MMQADAFELAGDTIQLEATFLGYLDGTDTNLLGNRVEDLLLLHQLDDSLIEMGCLWRPQFRMLDVQLELSYLIDDGRMSFRYHGAIRMTQFDADLHTGSLFRLATTDGRQQFCSVLVDLLCTDKRVPGFNMLSVRQHEGYWSVDTCSRIPARALLQIFQIDL